MPDPSKKQNLIWTLSIGVWLAGAVLVAIAWNTLPRNTLIDLVLYLIAFMYFMALIPIKNWIEDRLN